MTHRGLLSCGEDILMEEHGTDGKKSGGLTVSGEEAGLKVIGLLERHFGLPKSLLHRWIRTGQVRVNGGRVQPFARVEEGDTVRVPPFAEAMAGEAGETKAAVQDLPELPIIGEKDGLVAVFKPAGLPTQPGTGHEDSASERLRAMSGDSAFPITPAHRLDRDTSGVLLCGRTFQALTRAQELFRNHDGLGKEYLAWVEGHWPYRGEHVLRHYLSKRLVGGHEKMTASENPADGREAVLAARTLAFNGGATLLLVRIFTGRTHQIRVQLAAAGYPIVNDGKYGRPGGGTMYLHCFRLFLPDGTVFSAAPSWKGDFAAAGDPSPIAARPGVRQREKRGEEMRHDRRNGKQGSGVDGRKAQRNGARVLGKPGSHERGTPRPFRCPGGRASRGR